MRHRTWPAITQTNYDRSACTAGVVHLGYGAFHRAHQAVYLDDYIEKTGDLRWGITAVNLRAAEQGSFAAGHGANGYLLKTVGPDGDMALRRVRCHLGFADWSRDRAGVAALLAGPDVHMVTITVTESGYYTDPTGALNPVEPVIAAEFAGGPVSSVYACLCNGLAARMQAGGGPLTVLCCDNIRSNGKMLHRNLAAYLAGTGQDVLAAWVDANVTFPCSMVDRITPRSTPEMRAGIEAALGPQDAPPIMAEAFVQWVLEDDFAGPMPDLAAVGVTVAPDTDTFIGIRPEHMQPCGPDAAIVAGQLELIENLGEYVLVHLIGEAGKDFTVKMEQTPAQAKGDMIGFTAPVGRIHRFDKATGLRHDS